MLLDEMKRGPVTVEVRSDPQVRYNVTASVYYDQQVPADLHHVLTEDDLAVADGRLHSTTPPSPARMRNTSIQPGSWFRATATSTMPIFAMPREDYLNYYVPVADDMLWKRSLRHPDPQLAVHAEPRTFARSIRLDEDWNTGLYSPGQVTQRTFDATAHPPPDNVPVSIGNYCTMCRQGSTVVPWRAMVSGAGHIDGQSLAGAMEMFDAKGTEIPFTRRGSLPVFELPSESGRYTATLEESGVSTKWTFVSAEPTGNTVPDQNCIGRQLGWPEPCAALPLVYLSYDLGSGQRLDNTLPANRAVPIGVRVSPAASTDPAPAIVGLKVWTSFDSGETWKPVRALPRGRDREGERWYDLRGVRGRAGQKLSIKAEAWDADGSRIKQVITDQLTFR